MRMAVVGGTGTIGKPLVEQLCRLGHEVRVLSRHSSDYPIDLATGNGLDHALRHCEVVVDASNDTSRRAAQILVEGSKRLLAAEQTAGVRHHICLSIVGCDRAPFGYYGVKVDQERAVERGGIPWSVIRSTQVHEFIAAIFAKAARWHVLPLPRAAVQPVASAEAAQAIGAICESTPRLCRVTLAGPEIIDIRELAHSWSMASGRRALFLNLPLPGKLGHALRNGVLTSEKPDIRGTLSFADWLAATKSTPTFP